MSDKNNLVEYKDDHYGKMFISRPVNFATATIKINTKTGLESNLKRLPYDLYHFTSNKEEQNSVFVCGTPYFNIIDSINYDSFYETPDKKYGIKFPKKIPLMLIEEFSVTHFITGTKIDLYKILCIFPDYIKVPPQARKIQFYGQKNWFQPYAKSTTDVEKLLREIKAKYSKKY